MIVQGLVSTSYRGVYKPAHTESIHPFVSGSPSPVQPLYSFKTALPDIVIRKSKQVRSNPDMLQQLLPKLTTIIQSNPDILKTIDAKMTQWMSKKPLVPTGSVTGPSGGGVFPSMPPALSPEDQDVWRWIESVIPSSVSVTDSELERELQDIIDNLTPSVYREETDTPISGFTFQIPQPRFTQEIPEFPSVPQTPTPTSVDFPIVPSTVPGRPPPIVTDFPRPPASPGLQTRSPETTYAPYFAPTVPEAGVAPVNKRSREEEPESPPVTKRRRNNKPSRIQTTGLPPSKQSSVRQKGVRAEPKSVPRLGDTLPSLRPRRRR